MDRLCPPCAVFITKHDCFKPELVCVFLYLVQAMGILCMAEEAGKKSSTRFKP